MRKIKLLSSLLGLGAITGVIAPVLTSCSNEEEPKREQCTVSLSEDCSEDFTLGVTKIPKGHTLITTLTCTKKHYCDIDGLDISVRVGDKTLVGGEYLISNYNVDSSGTYRWTLVIYGENVVDDIIISINEEGFEEVLPIIITTLDRTIYTPAWAEPIPADDVEQKTTYEITINCLEDYYIWPKNFRYGYYGDLIVYDDTLDEDSTTSGWNFVDTGSWLTNEMNLYVNFGELCNPEDIETLEINCYLVRQSKIPSVVCEGQDSEGEELTEGEDYTLQNDLDKGEISILLNTTSFNEVFDEENTSLSFPSCEKGDEFNLLISAAGTKASFTLTKEFYDELFWYLEEDIKINFKTTPAE